MTLAVIVGMPPYASMGGQHSTRLDRHTPTGRQSKGHGKCYIEFAHFSGSKLANAAIRKLRAKLPPSELKEVTSARSRPPTWMARELSALMDRG